MRASVRVGGRVAAAAAFAATAALAVSLTRAVPLHVALTSQRNHPSAADADVPSRHQGGVPPECGPSGLDISIAMVSASAELAIIRFPVEFTNISGSACSLSGYPEVSAYRADGAQVGNAAAVDTTVSARRIVLAPGATAHAAIVDSAPGDRCRPVMVAGLRVVLPGDSVPRYIRHMITACSVAGREAPVFLHVRAVQSGTGVR